MLINVRGAVIVHRFVPSACPVTLSRTWETEPLFFKPYAQAVPGAFSISKKDKSPCTNACPGSVNAHGYVTMIGQGKYKEAMEVITRTLPMPGCDRQDLPASVRGRLSKRRGGLSPVYLYLETVCR